MRPKVTVKPTAAQRKATKAANRAKAKALKQKATVSV